MKKDRTHREHARDRKREIAIDEELVTPTTSSFSFVFLFGIQLNNSINETFGLRSLNSITGFRIQQLGTSIKFI